MVVPVLDEHVAIASDVGGGQPAATDSLSFGPKEWLLAVVLIVAVFLAYQPAWQGGLLWDDDAHVTRPSLCSWEGLYHIWFDVGVTLQYYPLLHSAFWIEHKLWGDSTLGYHLVNLALHALSALMVAVILRRLKIPGAFLAAAIFALHPVHVESVAWMTEQKNTLSGAFYLGAMLTYLRFDQTRKTSLYLTAAALFSLGMLCKTVIATLPGALLVIFWWQRGRLSWKKDVLPLVPFFLLGAGGGMITSWYELKINKCDGPEFIFTPAERILIAGRAFWFYLWKLLWPTNLTFIYPRWAINAYAWPQYLFPLGAAALLPMLWAIRRWTRAPLAAALFFGGTLFPVLGFFNLYTFLYSFVANHYQYLASLGVIVLASAGIALLLERWRLWRRPGGYVLCLTLLALLAGLTWRQSRMYTDIETLYRTTIEENPECCMAHLNLGKVLSNCGRTDEAIAHYRKALEINPKCADACNNIGAIMNERGQYKEALAILQKALDIDDKFATAHGNLAAALARCGQTDEAVDHYQMAIKIIDDYQRATGIMPHHANLANLLNNLGAALANRGQLDEAVAQFRTALKIDPNNALARKNLDLALAGRGRLNEAFAQFAMVYRTERRSAQAHNDLGRTLADLGQVDEAIDHFRTALEINPDYADADNNLGMALARRGRINEAIPHVRKALEIRPLYEEARANLLRVLSSQEQTARTLDQRRELIRVCPKNTGLLNETAWILATSPSLALRNRAEAVDLAQRAVDLSDGQEPAFLDTLAAAYAETGQFAEAVQTAEKAVELATQQKKKVFADAIEARIRVYKTRAPFRQGGE